MEDEYMHFQQKKRRMNNGSIRNSHPRRRSHRPRKRSRNCHPMPKEQEETIVFQLKSSRVTCPNVDLKKEEFINRSCDDENLMIMTEEFVSNLMVRSLWTTKNRMDNLFDSGNGHIYSEQRDSYFPLDTRGSKRFRNRAGDKLLECIGAVDLFDTVKDNKWESVYFIDCCGGPGAFSQVIIKTLEDFVEVNGCGMTLRTENRSTLWYDFLDKDGIPDEKGRRRFTAVYGDSDTGDVYKPENLKSLKTEANDRTNIFVSDGGFKIRADEEGNHKENLQETFSGRIVISELCAMLMTLQEGGVFVCKLFDTFSYLTISVIYICTQVFEECFVVKPRRSRIVNSERYLIGKRFLNPNSSVVKKWREVSGIIHSKCDHNMFPLSLVPLDVMRSDEEFVDTVRKMNETLGERQIKSLNFVMDQVDIVNRSRE